MIGRAIFGLAVMLGSLAAAPPPGAPELAHLELYLGWRANDLPVETSAVRP
jgi:hypothetical protein